MQHAIRPTGLTVAVVGAIVVSTCFAAASLKRPRITQEMQSLSGINTLHFIVSPLPTTVADVDIDEIWIRDRFEPMLRDHEFTLTLDQDPGDVHLRLTVFYRADDGVEDGVAFVCFLAIQQRVGVERLGKDLFIPTWTVASIEIAPKADFRERLIRALDDVFHDFVVKHDVVRMLRKG